MKKLRLIIFGLSVASITFIASTQAMAEKVMRVGSWLPPKHTMNAEVLPTWGKWISEATEGRVKLKIEYPGGHPKALLDQVQDGAYDASWTFHGYFPGRFKLTKIVELPNLGADAETASIAHWRINEKILSKSGEHKGITLAGLFTHGPGQIHLREPVKSLSELKGKKIRIGGGVQTEIANRLGIEGVAAPGSKVYEILSQGVADGVFMPMSEKRSIRLKEVAPFTLKFPNGMYLGSFGIFLNDGFLSGLGEKDLKAIMAVSGEKLSALAGKSWDAFAVLGERDARDSGNTIMDATPEIIAEFDKLTDDMEAEWLESIKDRGIDGAAALKELRETVLSIK